MLTKPNLLSQEKSADSAKIMCQQYLMSPQNSWWWLSKNMLCHQTFDESAKWANLAKIRRVSKKTWWVRNMSGDDSTKRVLKSVLSVQFTCKSHSIHSCMHPWTSTIIVIRRINSYAMAKWNALHSSRVLMSSGCLVLVQEARCKDVDGWVDARMLNHTQPILSSAASSVLFHVSIPVFLFKLLRWRSNAAWRRSYNSYTVSLLCDAGCRVEILAIPVVWDQSRGQRRYFAVFPWAYGLAGDVRLFFCSGYLFRVAWQSEWPS